MADHGVGRLGRQPTALVSRRDLVPDLHLAARIRAAGKAARADQRPLGRVDEEVRPPRIAVLAGRKRLEAVGRVGLGEVRPATGYRHSQQAAQLKMAARERFKMRALAYNQAEMLGLDHIPSFTRVTRSPRLI